VDLTELDGLAAEWRAYVAKHPVPQNTFDRSSGYQAGLLVAAGQLEDVIARMRADQEA